MAKILVIENDGDDLDTLCDLLVNEGYDVIGASDGINGEKKAKEQLPDLILCDLHMLGLNGFEVLDKLSKDPKTKDIPIILVSGESKKDVRVKALELGAADFIVKGCANEELLLRIKKNLKRN